MLVQPYLMFDGRCQEALDFYRDALDAEIEMLMRFSEAPEPPPAEQMAPGWEHKIMHSSFRVGECVIMASDGMCQGAPSFAGITLSLGVNSIAEAEKRFAALSDGGKVTMPLGRTFWAVRFGMCTDRFGVSWMINCEKG